MTLRELIQGVPIEPDPAEPGVSLDVRVCDVTDDSRTVVPGSLFIARRGLTHDANRSIPEAVGAGAVAVLTDSSDAALPAGAKAVMLRTNDMPLTSARVAERFYGSPSSALELVGVTGTNGKTTVCFLIHQMANLARRRCGLCSTVLIDDGRELAEATLTTPQCVELSHTLAQMVDAGCTAAALEVSSHALAQRRVGALGFDVGIFTNLSGDHLDFHGSMEAYADAKAMLFEGLPESGTAIVNGDDPASARMVRDCRARVLRTHARRPADAGGPGELVAWIEDARPSLSATYATLVGPWGRWPVRSPLVGRHNLSNVLQAAAAGWVLGLSEEEVAGGHAAAGAPPGRLERVSFPGDASGLRVFVDFAHTDDALARTLAAVREAMPGGSLWVVFGCGGDRDRTKRPRMGAVAASGADRVVVTSDNPRTEAPDSIVSEVLSGIDESRTGGVSVEVDRARAIEYAIEHAEPGDVVVIAGKGHEAYQILPDGSGGTFRRPFDDRDVALDALARRGVRTAEQAGSTGAPTSNPPSPDAPPA